MVCGCESGNNPLILALFNSCRSEVLAGKKYTLCLIDVDGIGGAAAYQNSGESDMLIQVVTNDSKVKAGDRVVVATAGAVVRTI